MLKDDRAVSPIIGELLMIVVVIIIAAMLATYAAGILHAALRVNSVNIMIEGAKPGSDQVTIVHMGGDTLSNAFQPTDERVLNETVCENLEIRINGAIYAGNATLNRGSISKPDFEIADELELLLAPGAELKSGDRISVVSVSGGQVLQWTVVV
ncbi:MAG: type IV pilin N-terminal domain-containing protein [Methanomicrobia archaeon]|nr:type IV pilin N-terminal domain-containing protein [Methanomicrobia archaeon]